MKKKSQVGTEYLIIVGFITLAIMAILLLAYFYSNQIKDRIKLNQIENFAVQLINSAESVFFAGEPSKTTIKLYLPEDVKNIEIDSYEIIITTGVSAGEDKRAFDSKVPLNGSITATRGIKRISIEARINDVQITQLG